MSTKGGGAGGGGHPFCINLWKSTHVCSLHLVSICHSPKQLWFAASFLPRSACFSVYIDSSAHKWKSHNNANSAFSLQDSTNTQGFSFMPICGHKSTTWHEPKSLPTGINTQQVTLISCCSSCPYTISKIIKKISAQYSLHYNERLSNLGLHVLTAMFPPANVASQYVPVEVTIIPGPQRKSSAHIPR